jgi:hypothetical protein
MGRQDRDQGQLFYCFNLESAIPLDHQVRRISEVLALSWTHAELAPHNQWTLGRGPRSNLPSRNLPSAGGSGLRYRRFTCS